MERFQGGLFFKAHRVLYHSTLGSRVITEKKEERGMNLYEPSYSEAVSTPPFWSPTTGENLHAVTQSSCPLNLVQG